MRCGVMAAIKSGTTHAMKKHKIQKNGKWLVKHKVAWKYAGSWILNLYSFLTVNGKWIFIRGGKKHNELILQLWKYLKNVFFPQITACQILGDYKSLNLENFSTPIRVL